MTSTLVKHSRDLGRLPHPAAEMVRVQVANRLVAGSKRYGPDFGPPCPFCGRRGLRVVDHLFYPDDFRICVLLLRSGREIRSL